MCVKVDLPIVIQKWIRIWLGFNRAAAAAAQILAPQLPLLNRAGRQIRRMQGNQMGNGNGPFRGNGPRGLQARGGRGKAAANGKAGNLKRNLKTQKGQAQKGTKGRKIKGRRNQGDRYQINKPWVTDEIKAAHEKKVELANKLKGNKNDELFAEFKAKRDEFVKLYDAARQEYNKNKVNDIRWSQISKWLYIKPKNKTKNTLNFLTYSLHSNVPDTSTIDLKRSASTTFDMDSNQSHT